MSNGPTLPQERDTCGMTVDDWARLDAMTDEEITARALSDPDALPISPERLAAIKPRPLSKVVRNKLRMTRHTFADAYGIPVDTLRAWERHETEPSPTETAYLRLIEREPERSRAQPVQNDKPQTAAMETTGS